jgi:DNA polymerase kappa
MRDPDELRKMLRHIAEELEGDLKRTEYKGRTLCLKIKLHTYEVLTRQMSPPFAVHAADDLYKYGLPMLEKLMKEIPNLTLRLMGLRVTNIVSTKKPGIDFFGRQRTSSRPKPPLLTKGSTDGEWEIWPEAEFEEAARQERDDEMNELEKLSQEQDTQTNSNHIVQEQQWTCPICVLPQPPDDKTFNSHIDYCLSRQTIKEAVKSTTPPTAPLPTKPTKPVPAKGKGKRGRTKTESVSLDKGREKRRAFFFAGGS